MKVKLRTLILQMQRLKSTLRVCLIRLIWVCGCRILGLIFLGMIELRSSTSGILNKLISWLIVVLLVLFRLLILLPLLTVIFLLGRAFFLLLMLLKNLRKKVLMVLLFLKVMKRKVLAREEFLLRLGRLEALRLKGVMAFLFQDRGGVLQVRMGADLILPIKS